MLRRIFLVAVTPTLIFPFLWAMLVLGILRLAARLESPVALLRRAGPATIEVTSTGLRINVEGKPSVDLPRAEVIDGWIEPLRQQSCLVLRLRGGRRLLIEGDDFAALRGLLAAAGASVQQQVFKVPLGTVASQYGQGPVFHLLGPVLAAMFSFSGFVLLLSAMASRDTDAVFIGVVITLLGLGFTWGLVRWATGGEAIVGADGITVRRLFRRRFVPHGEIETVVQTRLGVRVYTRGEPLDLPMRTFVSDRSQSSAALVTRIEEARAESHRSFDVAALELLDRRGRRVSAWRDALARIAHHSGDYRSSVLESADLAHVIEDVSAPPERRIGAAIALASLPGDPELKQRVRVAAQASASTPMRIALEKRSAGGSTTPTSTMSPPSPRRRSGSTRRARSGRSLKLELERDGVLAGHRRALEENGCHLPGGERVEHRLIERR